MARVKRGVTAHKRHKKVLAQVKGHYGTNNRLYKRAHESLMRSLAYAYRDRRTRKRDFRRLWIIRINAASRLQRSALLAPDQRSDRWPASRSIARCWPTWRCATRTASRPSSPRRSRRSRRK